MDDDARRQQNIDKSELAFQNGQGEASQSALKEACRSIPERQKYPFFGAQTFAKKKGRCPGDQKELLFALIG